MSDRQQLLQDDIQASAPIPSVVYPPPYPAPPPPPYQAAPYQVPPHTKVVVNQYVHFGAFPKQLRCPSCQQDIITEISYESGLLTWGAVAVMFFLGFWLCCWIPLVINDLKDVNHTCPNCHNLCGVYKRLS